MASGYGYHGGRSRCYAMFQDFMKCYAGAEEPQDCVMQKEDYMECLHRKKEIARAKEIKSHFLASQAHAGADARKLSDIATNGVIVSLGLITPEGGEGGSGGPGEGQKH